MLQHQPGLRAAREGIYDVIAIGAGAAGLNVAVPAAKLGLKTLLIDKRPENFGGECLNTGCVPSKALLHVAKLHHDAKRLDRFGIRTSGTLDFIKIRQYIRAVQEQIRQHDSPEFLESLGVECACGAARFSARDCVEVNGVNYRARRIILATGAGPLVPAVPGIEQVRYLTNENLFELEDLPARLLVIGGGPIGVEMTQAFTRLGSQVTLVENTPRLLARDSQRAADILRGHLEREGATVLLNSRVTAFSSPRSALVETTEGTAEHSFDQVLLATGKRPNFTELQLENAGIVVEEGRLKLDEYLRTTNRRVYACGDAAGQIYLTHVTELHGSVILWNLFSPIKKKLSYDDLSWVTFTDPEVATFGLSEAELRKRGIGYRVVAQNFDDVNRATTDDYPESILTVYLKGDRILGGTMVAPGAGELIQELILAKQNRIPLRKLLEKVYPYPTATRVNRWLAIYEYDKKMTSGIKKLLRGMFRIMA